MGWKNEEAGFWGEVVATLVVFNFGLSIIGLPWFFFGLPKFVMDYNKLQPSDFFWFLVSFLVVLVSWGISFPFLWELLATSSNKKRKRKREEEREEERNADWVKRDAEFNAGWVKRDAGWVKRDNAKLDAEQVAYKAKLEADKAKLEADKAKLEADRVAHAVANEAYKRIMAQAQAKAKRKNKGK